MAECVLHDLVVHHAGVPGAGQTLQARVSAGGIVDRLHDPRIIVAMLERFTLATFAEHLNDTFHLYPESGMDLALVLVEAIDLSTEPLSSSPRGPFSIVFRGP